jgi:hypothetical protein
MTPACSATTGNTPVAVMYTAPEGVLTGPWRNPRAEFRCADREIPTQMKVTVAGTSEAFNITTVADRGTNKFFLWAQAVVKLAE